MAKKKKTKPTKKVKTSIAIQRKTLFERIELFFEKSHHIVALIVTLLSAVLAMMMFDAKVSTGLDDSTYLQQGWKYSQDFFNHYFTSQAPFYAMFLAIPISFLGLNLVALKIINVLFFVLSVYFFYRAFRYKVNWLVLFAALLIYATNTEALRMASLTYTEAMYMFFQSAFLWAALSLIHKIDNNKGIVSILKEHWLSILVTSILFYFLYYTRTVGIASVVVFIVYFLSRKEWKLAAVVPGAMIVVYLLFGAVKNGIWENTDHTSSQSKILFQKDAYDASEGYEDFSGLITRALENTNQYFSSRFFEILGFRDYPSTWDWTLALLILIPLFIALFVAIKNKKKTHLYNILFIGATCGFTFLALQTSWGQARYIMILLGCIFIALFGLLYYLFIKPKLMGYQFFALIIMSIFIISNFSTAYKKAFKNLAVAKANLFEKNQYKGYTPDWENYLRLSKFCGDSLEADAYVACRKAPMSFIYSGGKEFYPIWRTSNNPDPDSTLNRWKNEGVTHVMVGNLRINAKTSQGGIINTVHRVLQPIQNKYPRALELAKKQGEYEEAILIRLNYDVMPKSE